MKITEEVEVPASKKTVVKTLQCEICACHADPATGNWAQPGHTNTEQFTKVKMRVGFYIPYSEGGGEMTRTEYDICTACFVGILEPHLQRHRAQPRVEHTEF